MLCSDVGPLDAKMMLIGEAPGAEEELEGKPFVGAAGHLLKVICKSSGLDYHACYVTNISSERPPGNNFGYFYEDSKRSVPKESLRRKWFDLNDKINRIKPRVVVCLGEEALRAVTNLRKIGSWRGTRIKAHGSIVIATYHPANVLRQYSNRVIVEMDLRKALRELKGDVKDEKLEIITSPTITQVMRWLEGASRSKNRLGFDIETIGTAVRSIAFARRVEDRTIEAISIPFIRMIGSSPVSFESMGGTLMKPGEPSEPSYWSKSDEELVLDGIASILEDPTIDKVGQNSVHFDAPLIERSFGIRVNNHRMDLMHAWHVLYPSLGIEMKIDKEDRMSGKKGLKFIASLITDCENYWTNHDSQVDQSDWFYNAMDAAITLEASERVDEELRNEKLDRFYYDFIHPLVFALLKAEQKGVLFDAKAAEEMALRLRAELNETKGRLSDLAGGDFNPLSPKHVKDLLYTKLGFPVVHHHKTRRETVDEDALRRLQAKYPSEPALHYIIKHRKISKLLSTYVEVKLDADGRVRCSYDASGTITGRISSSKTIFGTGMDLHNIPKGYTPEVRSTRQLYVASPGCVFVVGDLKQAETMVVAWILKGLGDSTLYDLYQDPSFDIHQWCAARFVYQILEDQVTKEQRQQGGKLANHSGNYMAGPRVMERRALQMGYKGFSLRRCKEILEKRVNGIPGLRVWWRNVEEKIKATRTLTTCFGRRLHFFGRLEGEELRSAVAFEPQSTVGDVCNKMFIELSDSKRWSPVLTTHDEIVLEVEEQWADEAAEALIKASRIPLALRAGVEPLIIPIDITRGLNWRDLK